MGLRMKVCTFMCFRAKFWYQDGFWIWNFFHGWVWEWNFGTWVGWPNPKLSMSIRPNIEYPSSLCKNLSRSWHRLFKTQSFIWRLLVYFIIDRYSVLRGDEDVKDASNFPARSRCRRVRTIRCQRARAISHHDWVLVAWNHTKHRQVRLYHTFI